jgi:hypothetical protein
VDTRKRSPETINSANLRSRFRRGFQDRPLGARLMIAASNCATRWAIVISPRAHAMLISDSVAASAFAGLPISRQDGRSATEPSSPDYAGGLAGVAQAVDRA